MRADRKKNTAKVAKEIINNPLKTEREIASAIGVNHSTVNRIKEELQQTAPKDDRIVWLTEKDFEVQLLVQNETVRRLVNAPTEIRDPDLIRFGEFAMKRYQLLRWDATERIEVQELDAERKAIIAKRYINV